MGRAHEVRAASMAKTAAIKSKLYSRFGKELYMAAKAGEPDPEMNLTLRRKIAEAKANQVPVDVIKRAIEKAKGKSNENYDTCRYEGYGPSGSTIIVDCLTDNVNRTISDVKTCFNKAHAKLGVSGCVSFNYQNVAQFIFEYEDEEKMLDVLMEADVEVIDLSVEEGLMEVLTITNDFGKAQTAIEELISDVKFDKCEITFIPNETITLENEEDKELWDRLVRMLNEVDDVQQIYFNVID